MAAATPDLDLSYVSPELFVQYKERIDQFEKERDDLLRRLEGCSVDQAELHNLQWENRKRAEEIGELQKALNDAQQYVYEERQRLLALTAENDELRLREKEDRQRIQQLLAVSAPLEQAITYERAGPPKSITMHPPSGRPGGGRGDGAERVMRTVFLPGSNTELLLMKLEALQAQLNEQAQLSRERLSSLMEERRIRDGEEAARHANYEQQLDSLTQRLRRAEELLRHTTRDYILARRTAQEERTARQEADARLAAALRAADADVDTARRAADADVAHARREAAERVEHSTARLRNQLRAREEELAALQSTHAAVTSSLEERCAQLEGRAARAAHAAKHAEQRRAADVDGFGADVTLLRKQIAAVDRRLTQMRLMERLDDDERLDVLLEKLESRAPPVRPAGRPIRGRGGPRGRGRTGHGSRGTASAKQGDRRHSDQGEDAGDVGVDVDASPPSEKSEKSELAHEMRAIRHKLHELDARVAAKKAAIRQAT